MGNIEKIQKVSRRFRTLFTALFWLIPAGAAVWWLSFNHLPADMTDRVFGPTVVRPQSGMIRFLAFWACMLPGSAAMYATRSLRRLFDLYARGLVFTEANVACFRSMGKALICWAAAGFLHTPISSVLLTYANGPGKRLLTVALGSDEIVTLLLGGVVLLISWVMDEGRRLEEEQALTI